MKPLQVRHDGDTVRVWDPVHRAEAPVGTVLLTVALVWTGLITGGGGGTAVAMSVTWVVYMALMMQNMFATIHVGPEGVKYWGRFRTYRLPLAQVHAFQADPRGRLMFQLDDGTERFSGLRVVGYASNERDQRIERLQPAIAALNGQLGALTGRTFSVPLGRSSGPVAMISVAMPRRVRVILAITVIAGLASAVSIAALGLPVLGIVTGGLTLVSASFLYAGRRGR